MKTEFLSGLISIKNSSFLLLSFAFLIMLIKTDNSLFSSAKIEMSYLWLEIIEIFSPIRRFIYVDLPTLGLPINDTKPE